MDFDFSRRCDRDIESLIKDLTRQASAFMVDRDEREELTKQIARLRASLNPTIKIDR